MDARNLNTDAMMLDQTTQDEEQQDAVYTSNINVDPTTTRSGTWEENRDYIDPALLDPTTLGHGTTLDSEEGMEDAPFEIDDIQHIGGIHGIGVAENGVSPAPEHASSTVPFQQPFLDPGQYNDIQTPTPTRYLPFNRGPMLHTPPMSDPSQPRLNAEALSFHPGTDWQGQMRHQSQGHHQDFRDISMRLHEGDPYEGYLTPTSAASAQNRVPPYYTALDSPTPQSQQASQHRDADSRYPPLSVDPLAASLEGAAPASNFNDAEAGTAPVHNLQGWMRDGPYAPHAGGNSQPRDLLSPAAAVQPRKKRSASQASGASFTCTQDDCSKTFATKAERDHHQRYHGNRDHTCGICSKGFHFPKDLKRHAKIHNPRERHLTCTILHCKYHTKGFHRQDHLDRHLNKVHGIQSGRNSTRGNTPA